jgi:glycyl-tRNA synthetase alpha chain
VSLLLASFTSFEQECIRLAEKDLVFPAYDFVMKCSHTFNLLDARGAISVTERASYIGRVRNIARLCAEAYIRQRERLGYPMLKK